MKIGHSIEQLRTERPAQGADRTRSAGPADVEGVAPLNTVALSAASRQLVAGDSAGGFDADKVAAVRRAIEQGTFGVDAGRIADRMIEQAGELLSLKSRS